MRIRASISLLVPTLVVALAAMTFFTLRSLGDVSFPGAYSQSPRLLDRGGVLLTTARSDELNTTAVLPLHKMPQLLRDAVIVAEDKRFLTHGGVDWIARASAALETLYRGYFVRGASTITEQTVRIIHPRKRTLWSRWIEGFEASNLERRSSKGEILEFYLNQLPYGAQRRGVAEAAQYYFDRDLDSLSRKELVALAVIPRAPRWYNPKRYQSRLENSINDLLDRMVRSALLPSEVAAEIKQEPLRASSQPDSSGFDATHFVSFRMSKGADLSGAVRTTLDAALQGSIQKLIDRRISDLSAKKVSNGAVLVVDHRTKEILAYVVSGALSCYRESTSDEVATKGCAYDAVQVRRQPGSAMKPFLYALALERGWNPATIIRDEPLSDEVGAGLHRFKNYSRIHYGDVTLRQALGNSLNIPAVRAIQFTGVGEYYALLKRLGFSSLNEAADYYDVGLALGAGEVTLFELVRAYAVLASGGIFHELVSIPSEVTNRVGDPVISTGVAAIIGDILSDRSARELEFGSGGVLNHPVQTAVKTGTSTDFKDSWAVGFDSRYVVGVWMGNLDSTPTDGLTGATGPALILRSVFRELRRDGETAPLPLSSEVRRVRIRVNGAEREELMTAAMLSGQPSATHQGSSDRTKPHVIFPTAGLMMAYDPRVPAELQAVRFRMGGLTERDTVHMEVNGEEIAVDSDGTAVWPLSRGPKRLVVKVRHVVQSPPDRTPSGGDSQEKQLPPVEFVVR